MTQSRSTRDDGDAGGAATATPAGEWHLARDGQQYGPLKLVEIAKLVELGHLKDGDLVWRAGFADWRPLGEVRDEIVPSAPKPVSVPSPSQAAAHAPIDPRERPNPADVTAAASAARASVLDTSHSGAAAAPADMQPASRSIATTQPTSAGNTGTGVVHGAMPAANPAGGQPAAWQKRLELLANRDFDGPIGGQPDMTVSPHVDPRFGGQSGHGPQGPNQHSGQHPGQHPAQQSGGLPQPGADPRLGQPRPTNLRQTDPRQFDPGSVDLRHGEPRHGDPRYGGVRPSDAMPADPRLAGGRQQAGPMPAGMDRRAMSDPRSMDPRARPMPADPTHMRDLPTDDEAEDDEPPRRGGLVRVLVGLMLLALIGAGTGYAYMNRATLLDMIGMASTEEGSGGSAVLAKRVADAAAPADPIRQQMERSTGTAGAGQQPPAEAERQAAIQPAMAVQQQAPAPPAAPTDARGLMATPLWASLAGQFPDWVASRNAEVAKLREQRVPDDTIDGRMMEAIVELRRKNADDALAAPPEQVISLASAFLVNLKALAAKSTDACYGFISRGETSPAVLPLIGRDGTVTRPVLAQLGAVVAAIAAGKQRPEVYVQPFASDYTTLSDELIKRGWSRGDLELFSNPQALSKASPEQVCRLVTGWFEAQLGIAKKDVQLRLLRQSLRPVVSG